MSDASYFDGWEQRLATANAKAAKSARRWCQCGHMVGLHFSMPYSVGGELTHGTFRCHYKDCFCDRWREDKRLISRIVRKIGKRK